MCGECSSNNPDVSFVPYKWRDLSWCTSCKAANNKQGMMLVDTYILWACNEVVQNNMLIPYIKQDTTILCVMTKTKNWFYNIITLLCLNLRHLHQTNKTSGLFDLNSPTKQQQQQILLNFTHWNGCKVPCGSHH